MYIGNSNAKEAQQKEEKAHVSVRNNTSKKPGQHKQQKWQHTIHSLRKQKVTQKIRASTEQ